MCLFINSVHGYGRNPRPLTASEPIVVYKMMVGKLPARRSGVMKFYYHPHTMYRLRKALVAEGAEIVRRGFHAYVEKPTVRKPICLSCTTYYVCKFTIPKGAKYYLGCDGDIVSTSIVSGNLLSLRTFKAEPYYQNA